MFDSARALLDALGDVGAALRETGDATTVVVIGGAALLLLGDAPGFSTRDVDIAALLDDDHRLAPTLDLPPALQSAAAQVAEIRGLGPGWLNSAVAQSFGVRLPEGAIDRGLSYRFGGLTVVAVSRRDLISLKLLAAVEQRFEGLSARLVSHV